MKVFDNNGKLERKIGIFAEKVSESFFNIKLESHESSRNLDGIDGYLFQKNVQIKGDLKIIETGNIYHEIYEKTKYKSYQYWRHSPSKAEIYSFITWERNNIQTIIGFLIYIDLIVQCERNKKLIMINPTSAGFLIPIEELKNKSLNNNNYLYNKIHPCYLINISPTLLEFYNLGFTQKNSNIMNNQNLLQIYNHLFL